MNLPLARQCLLQALQQPQIDLAVAALYIAQDEYPDLEVAQYLTVLDHMAAAVGDRLPAVHYPLRILQTLNQYLFEELGFAGNQLEYYDPRNSFLNQVIDRRTGIPITLALVYLEVARRINFPMVGVGFPGHFLIRPDREDMEIHVDPFHRGEILFPQDCQERLSQIFGPGVELRPIYFQAVTPQQFLVRMLTNLKQLYLHQNRLEKCLNMSEMLLLVEPSASQELRDRAILYYQVGRWSEAYRDLQSYLNHHPTAEDRPLIVQLLERIAQQM